MNKEHFFKICGYVLFAFWIISSIIHLKYSGASTLFWFCNISVAILAVACFERSLTLVYFILAQSLFFQSPWVIDWLLYFTTGFSFFNLVSFYEGLPVYFMMLTFIRHTITIPLCIIFLFLLKPRIPTKWAVLLWMFGTIGLLIFSYVLSIQALYAVNINCATYFCASGFIDLGTGLGYLALWGLIVMVVSLFSLYVLVLPLHRVIMKHSL